MSNRKRKTRALKKDRIPSLPPLILSDVWYTLQQANKKLDISISTSKRWRSEGKLKASKQGAKVYVNEYHIQQCLRNGLRVLVMFLNVVAESGEVLMVA